jgi:hypothetical protein
MKVLAGLVMTLLLGILPADADLSGRWNVAMSGHMHINNVVLEMKQTGTAITANCLIPDHGDLDMVGTYADGKLTLHTTENGFVQMTMTGTLKDDGSFSGSIESPMGTMTWTGAKASSK